MSFEGIEHEFIDCVQLICIGSPLPHELLPPLLHHNITVHDTPTLGKMRKLYK